MPSLESVKPLSTLTTPVSASRHRKAILIIFFALIAVSLLALTTFWFVRGYQTGRLATKRTFAELKKDSLGDDVVVRLNTKYVNGRLMYQFSCEGSEPHIRDLTKQEGGKFVLDFLDKDGFTLYELALPVDPAVVHAFSQHGETASLDWESSFGCSSKLYKRIANWKCGSNFHDQPSGKNQSLQNVGYASTTIPAPVKPIQRVIHGVALKSHFSVLPDQTLYEERQSAEVYLRGLIPEDDFKKRSDYNASMGYKILAKKDRAVNAPLETHLFIIKDQVYAADLSFNEHCSFLQILAPLITDYGVPELEQSKDTQTYKWQDNDTELILSVKAAEAKSDRTGPISFSLRYSDNALRQQFEEGKKALGLSR